MKDIYMEMKAWFPRALVVDAALEHPITSKGWNVTKPGIDACDWTDPEFHLVLVLQDMLTVNPGEQIPRELQQIHHFYKDWADMDRIIVVTWPMGLQEIWPSNSFHIIEFSTHQFELWTEYKKNEDVLRAVFSPSQQTYEYNFVCMNRHAKPHREHIYERLNGYRHANCSLQSKGKELRFPNKSFISYERTYNNLSNLQSLSENLNTAFCSVVTESQYMETFGIITEKTFNAFVARHPFIMIGHRGALEQIRELGFETFDLIFDEEYDILPNSVRMDYALDANPVLIHERRTPEELWDLQQTIRPVLDFNQDFFFEQFGDLLLDRLYSQLQAYTNRVSNAVGTL